MIRNGIRILGITPEEKLPKEVKGQAMLFSETETIAIPEDKSAAQSLFEINIEATIQSTKSVSTNLGDIIILDGLRYYKILYTSQSETNEASILTKEVPFNTFIEIPGEQKNIVSIDVYIVDTYFDLLDGRHIYSYVLYLVDIHYEVVFQEENRDLKELELYIETNDGIKDLDDHKGKAIEIDGSRHCEKDEQHAVTAMLDEENEDIIGLIDIDEEYL